MFSSPHFFYNTKWVFLSQKRTWCQSSVIKKIFLQGSGCIFYEKIPLNYDQIMFHHFVYENSPVYGSIGRLFIPQFCWWCHHQNIVFATGMSRVTCFRWLASSVFYRAFTLFSSLSSKLAQNFEIFSISWFW